MYLLEDARGTVRLILEVDSFQGMKKRNRMKYFKVRFLRAFKDPLDIHPPVIVIE